MLVYVARGVWTAENDEDDMMKWLLEALKDVERLDLVEEVRFYAGKVTSFCLPNSADTMMDGVKNMASVLRMLLKAQVDFTSRHGVPYSADLATVYKRCFIFISDLNFVRLSFLYLLDYISRHTLVLENQKKKSQVSENASRTWQKLFLMLSS